VLLLGAVACAVGLTACGESSSGAATTPAAATTVATTSTTSTTVAPTTTVDPRPGLVEACVELVKFAAQTGDAMREQFWIAAGRTDEGLRAACDRFVDDEPAQAAAMRVEWDQITEFLAAASGSTTTTTIGGDVSAAVPTVASTTPAPAGPMPTVPTADRPCHPNYSPCLPVTFDIDCEGRGEDGPIFTIGPVIVSRGDPYELDPDGDGIACDEPA